MKAPELAEELADFWLPVLAERSWEERAGMLDQILGQLAEDTLDLKLYRQLVPLFLAAIIDRLGVDEPVTTRTQARIYAQSAAPKHRAMALERFPEI
ncbi:MAG: PilZ domain-containing protein, partial [Halorhodospira sp.]